MGRHRFSNQDHVGHGPGPAETAGPEIQGSVTRSSWSILRRLPSVSLCVAYALAFGLPFSVYLSTLAPTIYNLDSAELTTAAYTGGLVRATGYPLYLMVGRAWSHTVLFGDVGYRMNLLSATCGSLTVMLALAVLRRLGVGGWASLGALGLLATSAFFWSLSLIAEVYTLHTALLAALLWALLRWSDHPHPARLGLASLIFAVGLGNQAAMVLVAPGVLWFVLRSRPRQALQIRSVILSSTALLVGLSLYLYLPWCYLSDPSFNYAGTYDHVGRFLPLDLTQWSHLWWLVSGQGFASLMMAYQPSEFLVQTVLFGREVWRTFLGIGVFPGILGLFVLWRRRRDFAIATVLMFGCHSIFFIGYRAIDKNTMFLPSYLIWALWLGVGIQWLLEWVEKARLEGIEPNLVGLWLMRSLLAGTVAFGYFWNLNLVDRSSDWSTRSRGEHVLRRLEEKSLLIGGWTNAPVVQYLQFVEGRRPDVEVINRFHVSSSVLPKIMRHQIRQRPVYIDFVPVPAVPGIELDLEWPLFRVSEGSETSETPFLTFD